MQIGVETSRAVQNKRIFVVSDDDITRSVLQFMLQDENETHDLPNMQAAYAKAAEWKPDLLLLGLEIADAQGAGIFADIRKKMPSAKIMLVADPGQDARAQDFLKAGAHSVLTKPLTVEAVRRKVDAVLGLGNAAAIVQLSIMPAKISIMPAKKG